MNGDIPKSPNMNDKLASADYGDEQKLLPSFSPAPIIVKVQKSPNPSFRSRSRYRAGPTRKLRRRAVLKSGECNVLQSRISRRSLRFLQDIFTTLVDTQWRWTLLCFTLSFLLSWLGFAVIWWLIAFTHGDFDERHLPPFQAENSWTPCIYNIFSFTSCFLFSIETQHTIGYGSRSTTEECPEAIFVMCIQSIAGVMIQAFMVGIVFAKMSRPKQRTQTLLFSRNAVICQRDGELCLMFRVGDMRKSHIIGAAVRAQVIRSRTTKEGEILPQNQQELAVGTDGQNGNLFFIWPSTIVHQINAESPFYHMSAEDMLTERFEVVVILEGTIESTGQTTQARSSYLPQEILWGHRFEPLVQYSKERQGYEVDYSLFNSTVQVDTPLCSGKELAEFYRMQDELRHGTGLIIDEDLVMGSCPEMRCQCTERQLALSNHHNDLMHTDSTKSDNSLEESASSRHVYRDANCTSSGQCHHQYPLTTPQRDVTGQYKIAEVDPDSSIQVMGEVELQQLPEAVSREILKNSREIVYEEDPRDPEAFRDEPHSIPHRSTVLKKGLARFPLLDEERRSLNGSRRNLSNRNLVIGCDDDRRSLNGSRRNLNGSRRYLLVAMDGSDSSKNLSANSRENLISARRHTGSKERLNQLRRNICMNGVKGSKETPELRTRRRLNGQVSEPLERVSIETEKMPKEPFRFVGNNLQESPSSVPRSCKDSSMVSNVSSMQTTSSFAPLDCFSSAPTSSPLSIDSNPSPESGFYDSNRQASSPEFNNKRFRLPNNSIITRNRRSYEHAQLQDVNKAFSRTNSGSSTSDSDASVKNLGNNASVSENSGGGPSAAKPTISYTSV
ncbi:uncharacterized protein [Prorops nasuta]|uniref:uncharacterized protein n=1 Tax=Prorops nasuta TaxID=863751 RepID=UPI0034CF28B0